MDKLLMHLASYAVGALWQVPALAGAGWLMARLLRRLGPAVEHNVWELTLLLCVLIPALPAPRATGHAVGVNIADAGINVHSTIVVHTGMFLQRSPLWVPREVLIALCVLWIGAALWGMSRLLLCYARTRNTVRNATPITLPAEHEATWQQCLAAFRLRDVRVLTADNISGPATVSIQGHALLLPGGMVESISLADFRAAAAHECAHMQRHDFRKHLLYRALALPIGFHPVTHLVQRQLAATREIACDEIATAATGDAPAYRNALLRLAAWIVVAKEPTLAMGIFDMDTLEERMVRLTTPSRTVAAPLRYAAVAVAALCLCATSFAAAAASIALAPGTTQKQKVYAIGKDVTAPHLIHQVDPEFPAEARKMGSLFNGDSVVGLTVDERGVPQDVHIVKPLGNGFDENAMTAVKQYRFRPALHNGQPVAVAISITVNYQKF